MWHGQRVSAFCGSLFLVLRHQNAVTQETTKQTFAVQGCEIIDHELKCLRRSRVHVAACTVSQAWVSCMHAHACIITEPLTSEASGLRLRLRMHGLVQFGPCFGKAWLPP